MRLALSARIASFLAIAALVGCGFWFGAFAWFGGFVWVKQLFGWSAFAVGLGVTLLRWWAAPRCWPWHAAFFVVSQCLFACAVAVGQVFYVGPSSTTEAVHLFGVAIVGGL